MGLHLAQQLGGLVTVGFGAKSVNDKLGDASGTGVTFDAGVMFHYKVLGLGMAAQNVGGKMKYSSGSYDFPTNYGIGGSLTHAASGLSAAGDINFPNAYFKDAIYGPALKGQARLEAFTGNDPILGGLLDLVERGTAPGAPDVYNAGFAVFTAASVLLSFDPFQGTHGALWLIGCLGWRVLEVPDVGEPFDVDSFRASLPSPAENEAGELIRKAMDVFLS